MASENRPPIVIPPAPSAPPLEADKPGPIGGMPEEFQSGMVDYDYGWGGQRDFPKPVGVQYWSGDEWQPARWSPERIATIQRDLASAGLIGPRERVTWGVWDPTSAKAYRELLGYANSVGLPAERALDLYATNALPMEEDEGRAPLLTRLSNPADLRSVFKRAATELAGEAPDDLVEKMVAAYQAQEATTQQAAYGAQETGGSIVEPPSPQGFAEDQLRREMPVETGAVDMLNDLKEVNAWLGFD